MKQSTRTTGALAIAGLFLGTLVAPASASESQVSDAGAEKAVSVLEADFSQHVELSQALAASRAYPGDVVGVRFENDQVVGEYFLGGDKTPGEFLAQFNDMYGTAPEVSSLLVAVEQRKPSIDQTARRAQSEYDPLPAIDVTGPEFEAPSITEEAFRELREGNRGSETPSANRSAPALRAAAAFVPTWQPQTVYSGTIRSGSSQYFYNSVDWYNPYGPQRLAAPIGVEFEINLTNSATGTRGSVVPGQICGPNFRDQFIAKNYNLNSWSISSFYGGVANAYPYADLNDLFDSCGLNSMAVGLASPYDLPSFASGPNSSIETFIDAKVGTKSSSGVHGLLQLVNSSACPFDGSIAYTDCMGVLPIGDPGYPTSRATLSRSRGWTAAPNRCWISGNYGQNAPISDPC